jgi:hypothetical protein
MLSFAPIGKSQEQNGSIHPSASNQISKISLQPELLVEGTDPKEDQLAAAHQALKQARKFLKAPVWEAKKQKP